MLGLDLQEVAHGDCGEGMDHALRLINDVHYRVGRYYQHQDQPEFAAKSFEKYLHNRARGVTSTYDAAPVQKYLDSLVVAK